VSFDTGDIVKNTRTGEQVQVACVHGDEFHPTGFPDRLLPVGGWDLEQKANSTERRSILTLLASSTASSHRPHCARKTIETEPDPYPVYYDE
jgi:hypothetical protein